MSDAFLAAARRVRLLVMDVDGVLTDGGVYVSDQGEELKKFNVRDGKGVELLRNAGMHLAIITQERSEIVLRRAEKLQISDVFTGIDDKWPVVQELMRRYNLAAADVAYVGDDVGDLDAMRHVGCPIAVADAVAAVKGAALFVCGARGGEGAVRELADHLLAAAADPAARVESGR